MIKYNISKMSEENSFTTPIAAGQLKQGMNAILKNRPCKIISMSVSKTGKHGHAKAHFIGTDVFTGKKYEEVCPTTHTMWQPILEKKEYVVADIDEEYFSLLNDNGDTKDDLRVFEGDMFNKIQKHFYKDNEVIVCILSWGEEEAVISFRIDK